MPTNVIGWDIGGAHLKAARVTEDGFIEQVVQTACPLWKGIDALHGALETMINDLGQLQVDQSCHGITMTGELADLFPNREEGVKQLLNTVSQYLPAGKIEVFVGQTGFLDVEQLDGALYEIIASANWMATALFAASQVGSALFVDIGSTTTDIMVLTKGDVNARGLTDYQRLQYEELIYSGLVRTPVMAVVNAVPFEGQWISLMSEHFATLADVYRLCGELPEHVDQLPTADGNEKTLTGSARRLARMLGRDMESAALVDWQRLAGYIKQKHISTLQNACERQLSRGLLSKDAPIIGAGVGRYVVKEIAGRLGYTYIDFADFVSVGNDDTGSFNVADCAPAVATAILLLNQRTSSDLE
ncbi:MAG: hydantoinase/oxoprolinase family protein [Methylococcales bacterium]